MGEYLKINGESCKLGTCENLYYTTYKALSCVTFSQQEEGNASLSSYLDPKHGFRYRFPFPDEDKIKIGNYQDYNRGELFTINRANLPQDFQDGWEPMTGWSNAGQHKHLRFTWKAENPNNTAGEINFEIVQQKFATGESESAGLLVIVCRCPYTDNRFRIESKEDMLQIVAAISERYMHSLKSERFDYYDEFCRRIYEGYKIPYISKKEYLQELQAANN